MLGSVETLRRLEGRLDEERRARFFSIALRQGERLLGLIEDLLLTASVEQHEKRVVIGDVDLPALLDEVAVDLADLAGDRIVVRFDGEERWIRTDGQLLRHVVTNLAENATKYAPGGPIELRAATGRIGDVDRALVRVVDHGPGIPASDRVRAFARFVQLDGSSTRPRGGTGLGLYLSAQISHLLGGTLSVADTPGGGATFALSLPCELAPVDGLPDRAKEPVSP
jgi:two-component system OmpR family sensor kinase